ncbi:peptidyl-Lys metalloendopeptidase [Flagelloscypha sp. PMI_526]|nr:peptidyl-Lys metalloendopeptidase [Flagelloscypha sp. PMI_526]
MAFLFRLLTSLAFFCGVVCATRQLTLSLSGPESLDGEKNLTVTATIKNTGRLKLKILNDPRGMLSTLPTDKFNITHHGGMVPFAGIAVKYNPEDILTSDDKSLFTVLAPGECIYVKHNLNEAYNFSQIHNLNLTISPTNLDFFVVLEAKQGFKTFKDIFNFSPSRSLLIFVLPSWSPFGRFLPAPGETFKGCSDAQQASIKEAASSAFTLALSAYNYMSTTTTGTPRYTTWFGSYDSGRRDSVLSHFSKLRKSNFHKITYDCLCDPAVNAGLYAYGYPSLPDYLFVCPRFWQAPLTGSNSKAGAIVREASHWAKNGGTTDYTTTKTAALNLALTDPGTAVNNADSYEYFAENTPTLS